MFEDAEQKSGSQPPGHETRDIKVSAVVGFAAGLVLTGVVLFFAVGELFRHFSAQPSAGRAERRTSPGIVPPEPRLQSNPSADLEKFRRQENEILNSYGWVNRTTGIVRIPIEHAMELVVQRGLPPAPGSFGKTPLQLQQEKANPEKSSR